MCKTKQLTIEQEVTVKSCPFCGEIDSVRFISDIEYFEQYDEEQTGWYIVCDFNRKGCGAAGGFATDKITAVLKWNDRAL